ncbi:hypothetical protein [Magnetospirillum sp. UT-4]|uniref:hypothetical protein n=1 Tax=Magnetospirillum sp. UT-4 TaxID=2681467 RepID=UPI0020C38B28|nr:hypothetical protein [Magnetospirillum sp. UT-4]
MAAWLAAEGHTLLTAPPSLVLAALDGQEHYADAADVGDGGEAGSGCDRAAAAHMALLI